MSACVTNYSSKFGNKVTYSNSDFEVEIGSVISTLPAEGNVVPQNEVLILGPASSIIKRIVKDVGSTVELGQAMIILDPTPIQEQIEKIEDQLKVKRNSQQKNL